MPEIYFQSLANPTSTIRVMLGEIDRLIKKDESEIEACKRSMGLAEERLVELRKAKASYEAILAVLGV